MIVRAAGWAPESGYTADNPFVGYANLVTIGNIAAGEEAAGYPASNLANPATNLLWKGTSAAQQYVTVSLGPDTADYLAVARHNFGTAGISVALEGWDGTYILGTDISSDGSAIGDMTSGGNLAAAFDGTTNQAAASSAEKATVTDCYVGRNLGALKRIFKAIVYGSNDAGYISGSNPSVTLDLYGNTVSPADDTDGTLLGTLTFTDTADEHGNPRTVTSTDQANQYQYVWVRVSTASSSTIIVAELQIYESLENWVSLADAGTPTDDTAIIFQVVSASFTGLRLNLQAGSDIPQAAVIYAGVGLTLQRRVYVGHAPINYSRQTVMANGWSVSGQFLGSIVLGETLATEVAIQDMTPDWYRASMDPFVDAARSAPFFYAWRPGTYPAEIGFAVLSNDAKPTNSRANGMMQITLQIAGVA